MNTTWSRRWPLAAMLVVGALLLLLAAELACRWGLGLGDPPLYEADPGFEYRLRPDQDLIRFGNHIVVNQWGMRSARMRTTKAGTDELRVMVFGDSVVNGGSQIDHSQLSTSLLQKSLQAQLGRPVTVGNISAGSWGPGNWLAYAQRFGFFDADVVVLVLGSGDHADNPSFAPLGRDHPTQKPTLAVQEALQRYLPNQLPETLRQAWFPDPLPPASTPVLTPAQASERGLADLARFLTMAAADGRRVVVLHHPDVQELTSGQAADGHAQIRDRLQGLGLPLIELATTYQAIGTAIYRDNVHHSVLGQRVMADVLHGTVIDALEGTRASNAPLPQAQP